MKAITHSLLLALIFSLIALPVYMAEVEPDDSTRFDGSGDGSLVFIENAGQFDARARFQVRGGPGTLWLAGDALWLTLIEERPDETRQRATGLYADLQHADLQLANLKLSFVDANPAPRLAPFNRLATRVSYFRGNDSQKWRTNVPVWGGVRYVDLYPGVDLEVTGENGRFVWRFVAHDARFDISKVRLRVEGGETVTAQDGYLYLTTAVDQFALPLPTAELPAGAQAQVRRVGEQVFDVTSPLFSAWLSVPDVPRRQAGTADASLLLDYATYLGGHSYDYGANVTVDSDGNAYVVGTTESPDFPTTPGVPDEFYNGGESDAFVAKLSADGSYLAFATFLGGVGDDWGDDFGHGVAVDNDGNIHVTGWTNSLSFPVTSGAYDTSYNGGYYDAFAAKLNAAGDTLLYATYLGGTDQEKGTDIAVSSDGSAYIVGWTASADFPSVAADSSFDSFQGGEADAFASKLNAGGSALEYALFIGGSDLDTGLGLDVDTRGYAYLTGGTYSGDFPCRLASDCSLDGESDAFVSCVRPSGGSLLYSTYLGGSNVELGRGIAVDGAGCAYVTGGTNSSDFPEANNTYNGGDSDAFAAKLDVAGSTWYVTYLGGADAEEGYEIAVDDAGGAYVVGELGDDAVTKLSPGGDDVDYRFTVTNFEKHGSDIAVDTQGGIYILAYAGNSTLPVTSGAFDTTPDDIWLAKMGVSTSISGQVTDSKGEPLVGIQVAANDVLSATTDAAGQYTLTVPSGGHTFAPTSPGYFWSPASRSVSVPPDMTGEDFVGKSVAKDVKPGRTQVVHYGDTLTYTVYLVAPEDRAVMLHDPVPTYTTFISGSLNGPPGVGYDAVGNAVSGALTLTSNIPSTVTFRVRVGITGTVGFAPRIVNHACVYPAGGDLSACEWSNETTNYTGPWSVYLPLIMR